MTIIHWLITTVAILITAYILPGVETTLVGAAVFAIVLALINIFIKPVVHFLALPLTVLTLGLFALVINAALILLAAVIVPGFVVANFWWALLFSLVVSLISSVLMLGFKKSE